MRLIDADKLIKKIDRYTRTNNVEFNIACKYIIEVVKEQPTAFDVEKAIGQYKWERDIAMYQLEQLGIGFGQKLEDEVIEKVKEVIRCV